MTWTSPVNPKLTNFDDSPFDLPLTPDQTAWISSLLTLGAAIGSVVYCFLADLFGRRFTILSLGLPFLLSYLAMTFVQTIEIYYSARFMAGLAVGGAFAVVPIYIAELADKSNRGALVSLVSCAVSTGILFSYSAGPFISVNMFNLILSVFPASFLISFLVFGSETPQYYILNKEENLAKDTLVRIRRKEKVDDELLEIKRKIDEQYRGSALEVIKSKSAIKGFIIAVGLLIFQQFSGINSIYFYGQSIFEMSGSSIDPKICPIIVGVVQFASSFTTPFLIDRFGRKFLLIASSLGMILCQISLGTYCYLKDHDVNVDAVSFLPVVTLPLFIFTYNSGCGPTPWIMLSEMFPTRIKTLGTSLATLINWTLAFLTTQYFEDLVNLIGLGESFWLFALCCSIDILFVKYYVIETKGKTLEEIQDLLSL